MKMSLIGKYRVVRRSKDINGESTGEYAFAIHMAGYEKGQENGKPRSITMYPVIASGDTLEQLQELLGEMITSAMNEPVLEWSDFIKEKPKRKKEPT